jgi:membrane-associated protease RseP (regulator of RpoE activity)
MKQLASFLAALWIGATATASAQHAGHAQVRQAVPVLSGSTTFPFRLFGNHIYVKAAVDGKTYAFVFDTGGGASLSALAERQLGLPVEGQAQIAGSGNGEEPMDLVVVHHTSLGGATLANAFFLVLPKGIDLGSPFAGVPFGGILGREFFLHLVLTIDYAHSTLALTDPAAFRADPQAAAIALTMRDGILPNVQASVDGVAGSFDVDAGSAQPLMLTEHYARDNGILQHMPVALEVPVGRGVGGPITGKAGRAESLRIGEFELSNVVTYVVSATGGAFSESNLSGNIGSDVLRRFTVTVDVPHKTLYLLPNESFGAPFAFSRAGIFTDRLGGAVVVAGVAGGSPAQLAGVRAGDALVAIQGKAVETLSPDEIRGYWMQPAGTTVRVSVRRGDRDLTFNLTLRDLL